ncbi:hypothetical protein BS78_04G008600 [Paspalum vaginatum]|nr:hypothetical protein BS78_04G008600 [Paspalum vaginatum]
MGRQRKFVFSRSHCIISIRRKTILHCAIPPSRSMDKFLNLDIP